LTYPPASATNCMALSRIAEGMASTSSGSVSSTCPSASITSDIGPPYRDGRTSISTKIESLVAPSRACCDVARPIAGHIQRPWQAGLGLAHRRHTVDRGHRAQHVTALAEVHLDGEARIAFDLDSVGHVRRTERLLPLPSHIARNAVHVLDDRERPAGRKRLQLKVNDGCGARGHHAEAGLDVVVETVRLVDDAKLLHFDSEHLRELMQRGRPHLLDEPAGHQQRLEARFLAEAEVLAADELRGALAGWAISNPEKVTTLVPRSRNGTKSAIASRSLPMLLAKYVTQSAPRSMTS